MKPFTKSVMIARYYEYNHMDPIIETFVSGMNELKYRYYASELLRKLLHSADFNAEASIRKAIAILKLTGVPVQNHFQCIYRSDASGIRRDWKMSDLACSLIIIIYDSPNAEIEEYRQALMDYMGV
jgi:hypothetical protein